MLSKHKAMTQNRPQACFGCAWDLLWTSRLLAPSRVRCGIAAEAGAAGAEDLFLPAGDLALLPGPAMLQWQVPADPTASFLPIFAIGFCLGYLRQAAHCILLQEA